MPASWDPMEEEDARTYGNLRPPPRRIWNTSLGRDCDEPSHC